MTETPGAVASRYVHVDHTWDDEAVRDLDPVERLVYRSNQLGADQRVTNTGGGNTSSKLTETDPLTGDAVEILWVKGSGGDLRTSARANFASLYMDRLSALKAIYDRAPEKGVKTEIEDRMVAFYPHCTFDLNPRASSIDTPLHAFISAAHVDHTHPNAVIAIAAAARSEALTREIYGDDVAWTPWQRPGFDLGLIMERVQRDHPAARGIMLGQHGIINWADDDKACYELSLDLIEKAARFIEARDRGEQTFGGARYTTLPEERRREILHGLLPWLRGRISGERRLIGTVQMDEPVLRFINSVDAPRLSELGTSCPDHFLRTKIKPLYVDWDPGTGELADVASLRATIADGIERYRRDYAEYYERCRRPDSPAMRDPNPTVVLVPGIGMITWGKSKSESRVTAEFYNCAIEVMRGAEAMDEYIALPQQEAFDIEYWALEEAKLRRMPPEKTHARNVVLVIGAGNGIGRAAARRLAAEGAHVVCADLDGTAAAAVARELTDAHGLGIGVAGSGISGCGPAIGLAVDVTDRASVRGLIEQVVLAYGGLDHVVITAGVYMPPGADGRISDERWDTTFDVNVKGAYIVADEARAIWLEQGLTGSLVLTTSVNGFIAKKGSLAYDTSKAAANHLVRELAVELAPTVRVNAVAPATVIAGSTMFPRDRVIASLTKYDLPHSDDDTDDALRDRLARFYAGRTMIGEPITAEDQAEMIAMLVDDRSRRTTGQIIAVDGGLPEAFVR